MSGLAIAGILIDAALAGTALIDAFAKFRQDRDPNETPEEAAAEFVREMISQVQKEADADAAIDEWLSKHGGS